MEELSKCILENKPNVSVSTNKTYCSLLKSLYYKHHQKNSNLDVNWFKKQDTIIKLLEDKEPKSRKTTYAALIAITGNDNNNKYKKELMNDGKKYQEYINTQQKSTTQSENWKDFDEIKELHDTMYNSVKKYLNSKDPLSKHEFKALQEFIIICITSGIYFPPRRSTDWTEMRIHGDINKEKDNYIDKNDFVFNIYKTNKFYDTQRVPIPKELKPILTKWIKHNTNDYLLVDENNNKLNNVKLGQRLNKIFGNKISTSMLRHIYLSDKLKDIPKLNELQELAKDMGHSVEEQLQYIKHNK